MYTCAGSSPAGRIKYRKRDETMLSSLLFCILMIRLDERPKDFHSSKSDKICTVDFITGKVETLGSTFSNETPLGGCLRPNATI